ncbi:hypothetical protein ACD591_18710 [Rufibacter glacialis]|uniref:Secreted protein n=1 Tax=Rufibacter glacialis TaxID=1259555 RepID=A0ABV4RJK3_9BACT|nr:hypothetical protein [Rufibacter glacialis]
MYIWPNLTVPVKNFSRYSALFLLLLFTRVMTPDALLLQLHAHEHTEEAAHYPGKSLVSSKHHHCAVDSLFQASFQAPEGVVVPVPLVHVVQHGSFMTLAGYATTPAYSFLRGPPAGFSLS